MNNLILNVLNALIGFENGFEVSINYLLAFCGLTSDSLTLECHSKWSVISIRFGSPTSLNKEFH